MLRLTCIVFICSSWIVNDEGLFILFPGVKLRQTRQCQESYAASIMKTKHILSNKLRPHTTDFPQNVAEVSGNSEAFLIWPALLRHKDLRNDLLAGWNLYLHRMSLVIRICYMPNRSHLFILLMEEILHQLRFTITYRVSYMSGGAGCLPWNSTFYTAYIVLDLWLGKQSVLD